MAKDKPDTSFEPEAPQQPAADPVALVADALTQILALLDARLPAAGGLLGAMPPIEEQRLFTVWMFPSGHITCDGQYGREVWKKCGKYDEMRDAVLTMAEGHDDIHWYRADGEGRQHEADKAYFLAGRFQP